MLGALGQVAPLGYALGRATSVVGWVLSCAALVFAARRAGGTWLAAVGALGIYASAYDETGTFYDLVRTDSLSMALLGFAIAFGAGSTRRDALLSGLCLFAAFTSKQHAALFGIPIAAWTWRQHGRRRAIEFVAAAAGPAIAFMVAMEIATGGTFLAYLVRVPAVHGQVADRLFPGAQKDLAKIAPVLCAVSLLALRTWWRSYWAGVSLTALVVVTLMRGHVGGYLNVLIPMAWMFALWPSVVGGAARWAWARHVLAVAVAADLAMERPRYERFVPAPGDAAKVEALVASLRELPDPILVPHAPYYPVLAGKRSGFALITLWDIDTRYSPYRDGVERVEEAIASGYWPSAVTPDKKLGHGFGQHFVPDGTPGVAPVPTRTGWPIRLRYRWRYEAGTPTAP